METADCCRTWCFFWGNLYAKLTLDKPFARELFYQLFYFEDHQGACDDGGGKSGKLYNFINVFRTAG